MRDPHVRFCERHGGVISRAYLTQRWRVARDAGQRLASKRSGTAQPSGPQPPERHGAARRGVDAARPWPAVE